MSTSNSNHAHTRDTGSDTFHVNRTPTGVKIGDRTIEHITLSHDSGVRARVTNYGATLTGLDVPDRDGEMDDVVLGFPSPERYREDHPYFGATIGRYANRISNGTFTLDDVTYELARNDGPHHLHGGPDGFHNQLWTPSTRTTSDAAVLKLQYTSPDGEECYPGTLSVAVTYKLGTSVLRIDFRAETDTKTIVNLTNHAYFNLSGHDAENILDHRVRINADQYTPIDRSLIPTGQIADVEDTPLNLTTRTPIGERVDASHPQIAHADGIDHNFVLDMDDESSLLEAAEVYDPVSGRVLTVHTTKPGLQLYSGNLLEGRFTGKDGAVYDQFSGFCLEPQFFPDAPNKTPFPSPLLTPGETYEHTIIYQFGTEDDDSRPREDKP